MQQKQKCKYMLGGHPCLAGTHLPYKNWCQPCRNAARELCKFAFDQLAEYIESGPVPPDASIES